MKHKERPHGTAFEQTQASPPIKFCQGETLNSLTLSPQDIPNHDENQTYSLYHGVQVVTSAVDIMPPFIFAHGLGFNTVIYIKCLEEVLLLWIKREAAEPRSPGPLANTLPARLMS